jgi:hypothetical protein
VFAVSWTAADLALNGMPTTVNSSFSTILAPVIVSLTVGRQALLHRPISVTYLAYRYRAGALQSTWLGRQFDSRGSGQ